MFTLLDKNIVLEQIVEPVHSMMVLINEHTAGVLREDGSMFTLSADSVEALAELMSMWQQPLETWDGSFKSAAQLDAASEDTVSVSIEALKGVA